MINDISFSLFIYNLKYKPLLITLFLLFSIDITALTKDLEYVIFSIEITVLRRILPVSAWVLSSRFCQMKNQIPIGIFVFVCFDILRGRDGLDIVQLYIAALGHIQAYDLKDLKLFR